MTDFSYPSLAISMIFQLYVTRIYVTVLITQLHIMFSCNIQYAFTISSCHSYYPLIFVLAHSFFTLLYTHSYKIPF